MDVLETIQDANLDEIGEPIENDCEEVAVALHRVFGASSFVCIFDPTYDDHPLHTTAKIGGELYDGHGKRIEDGLIDFASYLKPKDFSRDVQNYEEMYQIIESEGLKEFDISKYGESLLDFNEELTQKIVTRLESSIQTPE